MQRYLVALLWLGLHLATARAEDAPRLFRVTEAFFNLADRQPLGLATIRGRQALLYEATAESYRYCHHGKGICLAAGFLVSAEHERIRVS